ncbi:potassium voltage-gated channel subfamily A member 1-like [Orbicella faveolata]|uniref:potassium voltage-gated channel subfamily A member 1-like n=1 Tax=Orbicella faveolata TaxID=48498 RepID=UPI0009E3FA4A|nr:potassium voltage-gated channel subfamily A member 1-like [Orbicella faveolata]
MLTYINKLTATSEPYSRDMKSALRATNELKVGPKLYTKNYNRRASCPEVGLSSLRVTQHPEERRLLSARVKINISGKMYETLYSTLARFPNTLLGNPAKRKKYFDNERQEYFFNRNRNAFDAILFYYQSNGLLTRPNNVRLQEFCDELKFFQIEEETLTEFKRDEGAIEDDDDEPVVLPTNVVLAKIWLWFEYPKCSKVAKVVATFSVTFIAISIYVLCAETIDHDKTAADSETSQYGDDGLAQFNNVLELICVAWFTLEFFLRLVSCPNKLKFMLDILNLIDLAAIVPYYFELALDRDFDAKEIVDGFRLLRVSRLFKLARHLDELKVLVKTVRSTWRELCMILFFILITTAIFSGWTFYVEYEAQKDSFSSIPASAWFVIVSLTNVGYGDMVPVTIMGKVLGALSTLAGVLVIALPSPVIVTKFRLYYEKKKRKNLSNYKF